MRLLIALVFLAGAAVPAVAQHTGIAPNGKKGRLHVVESGDTLWDLSEQYLGTPWTWPSVWRENDIENPHLIYPGDLIWITEGEMRKVTSEEAERLMRGMDVPASQASVEVDGETADATAAEPTPEPRDPNKLDPFEELDASTPDVQRVVHYPGLHRFNYVTDAELQGAASILGSHDEAYWTSQEKRTIVSLGEGQAHIGDSYTVFRVRRRVLHPTTGQSMGYFMQILGKAEVVEIHPESSFVRITAAYAEIEPGDRLIPYTEPPSEFKASRIEGKLGGEIIAQMQYRQYTGEGDLVIIDRGTQHGVNSGSELEVYRAGKEVSDPVTLSRVLVPDDVIGRMFVLRASDRTSVALVQSANRPVRVGDHFRTF
jgi:quercetin dioxygenase-like cupin family protein